MSETRTPRRAATLRQTEAVTPLELFFDLVFVLAITQCTALMASEASWTSVVQGLLVLGVLWWAWVGYAWLTSVIDPEEGAVRIAIFAAMAGLLVVALCVPGAFGNNATLFAGAYAVVRVSHIVLFLLADPDDARLRRSILGLGVSSGIGVSLLLAASATDGGTQLLLWGLALLFDLGGPLLFGSEGWHVSPAHFAERHGLILIIALGESIVAIGVGAGAEVDAGVVAAAVLGIAVAAALWWAYFDVTAIAAERVLTSTPTGKAQNELARDAYSYLHLPMVAGVVLLALGLKKTIDHVGDPLKVVPAAALLGGVALYLLAHVAFRLRVVRTLSHSRLLGAAVLLALIPTVGTRWPALASLALLTGVLLVMLAYETARFGDFRTQLRRERHHDAHAA